MTNGPSVPLGFSDLNQDEAMLVSIFRAWYRQEDSEEKLRDQLQKDRVSPALTALFQFFRCFVHLRLVHVNEHEVLSPTEESLLAVLSVSAEPGEAVTQRCRVQLMAAQIQPRPLSSIHRSGRDALQRKVAEGYQRFMMSPL